MDFITRPPTRPPRVDDETTLQDPVSFVPPEYRANLIVIQLRSTNGSAVVIRFTPEEWRRIKVSAYNQIQAITQLSKEEPV